jgi:hypothetical protein
MAMSSVLVDGLLGEEFRAVMDSVYKDRTMYRSLVISNTEFPSSIAH